MIKRDEEEVETWSVAEKYFADEEEKKNKQSEFDEEGQREE